MNENWATQKTNHIILIMNVIICATLTAGYLLDVLKGRMEMLRMSVFLAIIAAELIVCVSIYLRNKSSDAFKYYSLAGYIIIYIYAIFNGESLFTYVFIFPVTILYVLYYNKKLIITTGIVTTALNIAKIIYQVSLGYKESDHVTAYTVQIAFVILVSMGLYVITNITVSINAEKITKILEGQKFMEENAERLYENINEQAIKSKDIVVIADQIKTLAENMSVISRSLSSNINVGMTNVEQLNNENTMVNKSSTGLFNDVKGLSSLTGNMEKIIKIISDIALNTNILSLNASVEAVRAGEHNKGFLAVAEEVGKLASQSDESANRISDIINSFSEKIGQILEEMDYLIDNNASQSNAINTVGTTFSEVEGDVTSLVEKINTLNTELNRLAESNRYISESTQKIAEIAERSQVSL